jgi:hypothetical protein
MCLNHLEAMHRLNSFRFTTILSHAHLSFFFETIVLSSSKFISWYERTSTAFWYRSGIFLIPRGSGPVSAAHLFWKDPEHGKNLRQKDTCNKSYFQVSQCVGIAWKPYTARIGFSSPSSRRFIETRVVCLPVTHYRSDNWKRHFASGEAQGMVKRRVLLLILRENARIFSFDIEEVWKRDTLTAKTTGWRTDRTQEEEYVLNSLCTKDSFDRYLPCTSSFVIWSLI